jgi:hypothetical protein
LNIFCNFCKRPNHDLSECNNAVKVLNKEDKEKKHQEYLARQASSNSNSNVSKPTKQSGKSLPRAGHTTAVELDKSLISGAQDLQESKYNILGVAVMSLLSCMSPTHMTDFNLDSGCSISTTPFLSSINNPAVNSTPICLAESILV